MQHIISKLVSFLVLLLLFNTAHAQEDSLRLKIKTEAYKKMVDTLRLKHNVIVMKQDSLQQKLYRKYRDTAYTRVMKIYSDQKFRSYDSLRKVNVKRYVSDSTRAKQYRTLAAKKIHYPDSLKRLYSRQLKMGDSFRVYKRYQRLDSLRYRTHDSLYRKAILYRKMDSLKVQQLKYRILNDSLKMKQLKIYYYQDSLKRKIKERAVTMELPYKKDDPVYIVNVYQDIVISTNNGSSITLTSKVAADKQITDKQWFEAMQIEARQTDSGISIRAIPPVARRAPVTPRTAVNYRSVASRDSFAYIQAVAQQDAYGQKKTLYISVPAGAPLTIVTKYADVSLENNVASVSIDISNGHFKMLDAGRLVIRSRYAGLQAGHIGTADIAISNSTLTTASVATLVIDSKNSKFNSGRMQSLQIKSLNDQYEFQQVSNLEGNKTFGKLSIQQLDNGLDINGSGADIKIGSINTGATLVKINNRYANVSLPLNKLTNYTASLDGSNSRVMRGLDVSFASLSPQKKEQPLTVTAGNLTGTHTRLQLNCNSCLVDLR